MKTDKRAPISWYCISGRWILCRKLTTRIDEVKASVFYTAEGWKWKAYEENLRMISEGAAPSANECMIEAMRCLTVNGG